MHTIKGYKDEWRIQEYLLLTFFISWLSWGILILLTALGIVKFASVVGMIFFAIGGFGPTIAAIICIEGKISFKKVLNFIFEHKARTVGYLLLLAVLEALFIALSSSQTNPDMPWYALPLVFVVCTLFGGGNEELGWRGTMQPVLSRALSKHIKNRVLCFIAAMLIIGLVWAIWHFPLWFVQGSTQQGMPFYLFLVATVLQAFWLGCIYARTRSVFFCMLFHGLSNVLMSFFVVEVNWLLLLGFTAMTVLAVFLASRNSPPGTRLIAKKKE